MGEVMLKVVGSSSRSCDSTEDDMNSLRRHGRGWSWTGSGEEWRRPRWWDGSRDPPPAAWVPGRGGETLHPGAAGWSSI